MGAGTVFTWTESEGAYLDPSGEWIATAMSIRLGWGRKWRMPTMSRTNKHKHRRRARRDPEAVRIARARAQQGDKADDLGQAVAETLGMGRELRGEGW